MSETQAMAIEIAQLKAEIARRKGEKAGGLGMKVSEKGALSVYGLGRFPVTLYKGQWEKLLAESDRIKKYLTENAAAFSVKE